MLCTLVSKCVYYSGTKLNQPILFIYSRYVYEEAFLHSEHILKESAPRGNKGGFGTSLGRC